MAENVPPELRAPDTPSDVVIRSQAPAPRTDPTLGVAHVRSAEPSRARHRLVSLGDSLTHGFQSFAIFNTDLSYPAIVARALGWYDQFRHPRYPGFGGLPLSLEHLVRELERAFGSDHAWFELPAEAADAYHIIHQIRQYWEHG